MSVSGRMIPNYIKAQSPLGLRLAMIKNNSKKGKHFQYFDIQFAEGNWIAWYFEEVTFSNVESIDKELSNADQ